MGYVPTVIIDKTDGCQMFLSKESLGVEIVSSKSSEMNVVLTTNDGDYVSWIIDEIWILVKSKFIYSFASAVSDWTGLARTI